MEEKKYLRSSSELRFCFLFVEFFRCFYVRVSVAPECVMIARETRCHSDDSLFISKNNLKRAYIMLNWLNTRLVV